MGKKIWMFNQYGSTPEFGLGGRSHYLARELEKLGHRVTLATASHTHILRSSPELSGRFTIDQSWGYRHVWVRTLPYDQAREPRRVLNWFLYSRAIAKLPQELGETPDMVLFSSPSLIGYLGVRKLAKKFKIPLVFDVRDIWPKTLIDLGGYQPTQPLIRSFAAIEKKAYQESDLVISCLTKAVEHMRSCGMDSSKFRWVPNGICIDEVSDPCALDSQFVERWPQGKFVFGYVGTVGLANSMEVFLRAAQRLRDHEDVAFVIVGKGPAKAELKQRAQDAGLGNIHFFDAVPKTQVQSVLARCDACYIGARNRELYRFGVSANKIPEYMYSERPVVLSFSGQGEPIGPNRCGIVVPAEDEAALSQAVLQLAGMSEDERREMGRNGKKAAIEQFSYAEIAKRLERDFLELMEPRRAPERIAV